MSFQFLRRLETLNYLIKMKATGSPKNLAAKLDVSERTLYSLLCMMKDFGAPISYSKTRRTYFYQDYGQFEIGFKDNRNSKIV